MGSVPEQCLSFYFTKLNCPNYEHKVEHLCLIFCIIAIIIVNFWFGKHIQNPLLSIYIQ